MKKPIDHFSLTDLRKSITEHESPLFTLTKAEMEGMVGRLEKAREMLERVAKHDEDSALVPSYPDGQRRLFEFRARAVREWLATLEREG